MVDMGMLNNGVFPAVTVIGKLAIQKIQNCSDECRWCFLTSDEQTPWRTNYVEPGWHLLFWWHQSGPKILGGRVKSPVSVKSHPRAWAHLIRKKSPQFVKNNPWSMKSAWAHNVRKHSIIGHTQVTCTCPFFWTHVWT
jgi:hypothetical protein